MSNKLNIRMCLNDDDATEVTVKIYQYEYEPGKRANFRGHPDTWDSGYGSVAYIHSYHLKGAPNGKISLEEEELDRLEELIIAHHEES